MVKYNELRNKNIKDEFWEWSADGAFMPLNMTKVVELLLVKKKIMKFVLW